MFSDLIDRIFNRPGPKSRSEVKRRLKKLLAHDRTTLSPKELEDIQREILEVVSRYVELDQDGLEFVLASDQRLTALVANLPIRRIKKEGKDDAEKRVLEIPADEPGDEPVPDNMTLDVGEMVDLGTRAGAIAPPLHSDSLPSGDAAPKNSDSKAEKAGHQKRKGDTENETENETEDDDDIFTLELEPDPVSAGDSQG